MFDPSREQARNFFRESWRKQSERLPLTQMESVAADIIAMHPEYQSLLNDPDALARDFSPDDGQVNPFLHLSLHLAIAEQLSIDQPPGIRAAFDLAMQAHSGDQHAALHDVLECLGETIWQAQRDGRGMDAAAYIACINKRARK